MKKVILADLRTCSVDGKHLKGHFVPLGRNWQQLFGRDCVIAGGPAYLNYFNDKDLLLLPFNVGSTGLVPKLKTLLNAFRLFRSAKGQIIVMQQSSAVTAFVAIALLYRNQSRLFMIQYNTSGVGSKVKRFLWRLARRKVVGIICPTERVGLTYGRPYLVVTDYIRPEAINIRLYSARTYDFCMIGTIWPDKGVVEVARKLKGTPYKLFIGGDVVGDDLRSELESIGQQTSNITMKLRRLNDEEFSEYMKDSRYAILNYQGGYNDRSSGIVLDYIFMGTPVVAHRCHATLVVEEQGVGILYDDLDAWNPESVLTQECFDRMVRGITAFSDYQRDCEQRLKRFLNAPMADK